MFVDKSGQFQFILLSTHYICSLGLLKLYQYLEKMINIDQSDSQEISNGYKLHQNVLGRAQFKKYAVYYRNVKFQSLEKIEIWMAMIKDFSKQKEGFQCTSVLTFLANIKENDSQYRLQSKEFGLMIQEIVEMFRVETDRILSEEDNEYQIISKQNSRMFKEYNRLSQFTEPLCHPSRLISLDLYACLHEINYKCQNSRPKIPRLITIKAMSDITAIPQIRSIEKTLRPKWEENFAFLSKKIKESFFGVLSTILFLVHLRRKLSSYQSKDATLSLDEQDQTSFHFQLPPQKHTFPNSHRFKYKFCQLALYNPKDITKKSNLVKSEISRKISIILERSQQIDQSLELRQLMLQYKLTFKTLAESINSLSGEAVPNPRQTFKQLEKCQWSLLEKDTFDDAKNSRLNSKEALSSQNFIGESICKIALKRFRMYASVLNIQNKLMKKVQKGTSVYIKRFRYSYKEYYHIHHKDISGSTCASQKEKQEQEQHDKRHNQESDNLENQELQEAYGEKQQRKGEEGNKLIKKMRNKRGKSRENSKDSPYTTIVLGFSEEKDQFAFKFNEQLQEAHYIQHIVNFLKTKHGQRYNVFLSEVDFERCGIFEHNLVKMVELFKGNLDNFVKFEACPSKYFYHLLVHTYVDKCLSQTPFEKESEFSEILSSAVLQIIRLINNFVDAEDRQSNIKDSSIDSLDQPCGQSDNDILVDEDKKNNEIAQNIQENCQQFDPKKVCFKISNILMKKMSLETNLSWQGVIKYTKKGYSCQYFLKQQDKSSSSQQNGHSIISSSSEQNFHSLQEEISDIQNRLLKLLYNNWPFLTDLQIFNKTQDFVSFLKEVNSGIKEIKSLFRHITRNFIIYQAYFHQLFWSKSEATKQLKEKYEKQIQFLRSFYKKEMENIEKGFPGQLQQIFAKLLNDFTRFPNTSKMIYIFNQSIKAKASQPILKVEYKVEENYLQPFKGLQKRQ